MAHPAPFAGNCITTMAVGTVFQVTRAANNNNTKRQSLPEKAKVQCFTEYMNPVPGSKNQEFVDPDSILIRENVHSKS